MANVLLIEPNAILSELYGVALQRAGHIVTGVNSADAALQAADQTIPGLVLLELQLTNHGGIEFLHEFRSYPEWQAIPIIIVSNTAPTVLQSLLPALQTGFGVVSCLYKPRLSLQKLLRVVAEQVAV